MGDSGRLLLDDWEPNRMERQIVRWAIASTIHTIYYKARHRGQPHALFRSLTDREPLATGMDVLWALQVLEERGLLERVSRSSFRLTESGRETGTRWALEDEKVSGFWNGRFGMREWRFPTIALILLLLFGGLESRTFSASGPPASDFLTQFGPKGKFNPSRITETLQGVARTGEVPSQILADKYLGAFRFKAISDQNFYVDLLATVEVMAEAWASRNRKQLSESGYRALVCGFTFPLPGCRPKSKSNSGKIDRARERLVLGAFASEDKRSEIRSRLKEQFLNLPRLEDLNLETVDIETYLNIGDLLK